MRRVQKLKSAKPTESGEDKKLKAAIKKFGKFHSAILTQTVGVQPLGDIEEVNMFKDDNTIIHFKKPQGMYPYDR